jgi:cap2 methyltransferase
MEFTSIDQLLTPTSPQKEYERGGELTDNHHGQLKLLYSELQFFTNCFESDTAPLVIYVGSSPGHHLDALFELFPVFYWHLYDPREAKYTANERVTTFQKYFTIQDAEKYKDMDNVYFISDIRTIGIETIMELYEQNLDYYNKQGLVLTMTGNNTIDFHRTSKNVELYNQLDAESNRIIDKGIIEDNICQMEWINIIKPVRASLKLRLPFDSQTYPTVPYYQGVCFFGVYNARKSTETRLVPSKNLIVMNWDVKKYESQCFYHNLHRSDNYIIDGHNYKWDDACAYFIVQSYLQRFAGNNWPLLKMNTAQLVKYLWEKLTK